MIIDEQETILVSACLIGVNCKYNGKNNLKTDILEFIKDKRVILVCPEQLGGLTTPRLSSEIQIRDGKTCVFNCEGLDVTYQYVKGAEETLRLVKLFNIKKAILKAKSPSCGNHFVYDGTFSNQLIEGEGITAKLLKENGVEVINEEEFSKVKQFV